MWDRLDRMQDATTDQHARLRSDMNANSDRLREELKKDIGHVQARLGSMENDLTTIKTERRMEEQRAGKNIAFYSTLAGVVVTLIIEVFKFLLHR